MLWIGLESKVCVHFVGSYLALFAVGCIPKSDRTFYTSWSDLTTVHFFIIMQQQPTYSLYDWNNLSTATTWSFHRPSQLPSPRARASLGTVAHLQEVGWCLRVFFWSHREFRHWEMDGPGLHWSLNGKHLNLEKIQISCRLESPVFELEGFGGFAGRPDWGGDRETGTVTIV